MEVITDTFQKITLNRLMSEISQKHAQLDKLEQEDTVAKSGKKDYIESSDPSVPKNYDEKDFERVLNKFKQKDAEIRSHEQAHATIGHTTSPISYTYQQGPDGKMYAVGGSVRLDTSLPDDPEAASFKLDQIKRAVTGVANPSGADMNIASSANLNKALITMKGDENANQ